MATWEDGPEYAPRERPAGFAAPAAPPLDVAPPRPQPSRGAPVDLPAFRQEVASVPLESVVPDPGEQRDPHEAFAVASSTLTEPDSAWGAVSHHHAESQQWAAPSGPPVATTAPEEHPFEFPHPEAVRGPQPVDPMTPITLTQGRRRLEPGFPVTAEPPYAPPPPAAALPGMPAGPYAYAPPPRPVLTPGSWLTAVRPATVALLLLGGVFWIISPLCFAGACWSGWGVRQRSEWVRNALLVGVGVLGVTFVLGMVIVGGDLFTTWDLTGKVSLIVCWLTLGAVGGIVAASLAKGEPPEQWS